MDEFIEKEMIALAPRLLRFARSLTRSAADAEDLAQATFERAIRNLDQWEPGTRLDSWMYRLAQNHFRDHVRRDPTQRAKLARIAAEDALAEDGVATAQSAIQRNAVAAAMERLPSDQRVALLLVAAEGRSYAEGAEITGASVAAVTSRVGRARETLRMEVGR